MFRKKCSSIVYPFWQKSTSKKIVVSLCRVCIEFNAGGLDNNPLENIGETYFIFNMGVHKAFVGLIVKDMEYDGVVGSHDELPLVLDT